MAQRINMTPFARKAGTAGWHDGRIAGRLPRSTDNQLQRNPPWSAVQHFAATCWAPRGKQSWRMPTLRFSSDLPSRQDQQTRTPGHQDTRTPGYHDTRMPGHKHNWKRHPTHKPPPPSPPTVCKYWWIVAHQHHNWRAKLSFKSSTFSADKLAMDCAKWKARKHRGDAPTCFALTLPLVFISITISISTLPYTSRIRPGCQVNRK